MAPRSRPTTPVRRVSRGSISSHHRASMSGQAGTSIGHGSTTSGANEKGTTPLGFLSQAMADLSYETATLQSNLEAVDEIQSALHTFDESFSMFLYGLKMNAFCVEWPEAPGEENFERAEQRRANAISGAVRGTGRASFAPSFSADTSDAFEATVVGPSAADQTYMTQEDEEAELLRRRPGPSSNRTAGAQAGVPLKSALKKPVAGTATVTRHAAPTSIAAAPVKITAAERKRRETAAEQVIAVLPLEYRGSDPTAKQLAMRVVLALIAAGPKGARINEIVRAPDLPQARVNKCMIALVAAKQVLRRSDNGVVYQLDAEKNPIAA